MATGLYINNFIELHALQYGIRPNHSTNMMTQRIKMEVELWMQLSPELIEEIFLRLTTKHLVRISCLSKSWLYKIFADRRFAKAHMHLHSQRGTLSHSIFAKVCEKTYANNEDKLVSIEMGNNVRRRTLRCPFIKRGKYYHKINSVCCNGLLCLAFQGNIYLWNPTTNMYKTILFPSVHHEKVHGYTDDSTVSLGFGHVSSSDDYIVVAIHKQCIGPSFCSMRWSSSEATWTTIDIPSMSILNGNATLANEALHWINDGEITAFNLAKGDIHTFAAPHGVLRGSLGVDAGGHLTLSSCSHVDTIMNMWVLNDHNVPGSWSKLLTFNMQRDRALLEFPSSFLCTTSCTYCEIQCYPRYRKSKYCLRKIKRCGEQEKLFGLDVLSGKMMLWAIKYEETLLWIG